MLPPLEITNGSGWLDAFLNESRSERVVQSHAPKSEFNPITLALRPHRDGSLQTLVAVTPSQFKAVESLVRRRYAWRGYSLPTSDSAATTAACDQESMVTLLVEEHAKLVGTLTLRLDSPQGLLAEQTYGEEIKHARSQGCRVGELIQLAMKEGVDWKSVLDALLQAIYLVARMVHSLTDVFIEVNPRHVRFHQRVFGFAPKSAEKLCARVGAPSMLMHLDLEQFTQRLQLYTT